MDTSLLSDVVTYSAQVACVVAIGGALAAVVRIDAAGVRYLYWRALLALCLALPWLQARQAVAAPEAYTPALLAPSSSAGVSGAAAAISTQTTPVDWFAVVGWILAAGIVIRLARIGVGFWRLRRLRTDGYLAPRCDVNDDVQQLVRVRAEIRYVASGQPVTFGFRRPVVLLPEILRSQPAEIRRVVLCHELFHVRRRDWVWVVTEELLKAVLWFHPAVLWLISRVRLAREEVVDELTVLATSQRRAYMEALLVFADASAQAPAVAFARRRHLFRRMVLISKEAVMSSWQVLLSSAAMAVIVMAGSWFAVSTFPLTQIVAAQGRSGGPATAVASSEAGPLERKAKPITPENPIPRRTFSVTPQNPGGDDAGMVIVTLRVTVDGQGRVGEVRAFGGGAGGRMAFSSTATRGAGGRGVAGGATVQTNGVAPPSEAFVKSALAAVRQWLYDPPADAPISFDVTFAFARGEDTRLISHGGPMGVRAQLVPPLPPPAPQPPLQVSPPPPPPPPPGWAAGAVRVGGSIMLPQKVRHVDPLYPPIAQAARVQGVVIVELIIDREGRVGYSRVLRSIPLLDQAALDAVNQWEFTPTHLNGAPAPVIMTATVNFSLQ